MLALSANHTKFSFFGASGVPRTKAFTTTNAAPSLLIVNVVVQFASANQSCTVTDSANNTYTAIATTTDDSALAVLYTFYALNTSTATVTCTVTPVWSGGSQSIKGIIQEFTGVATATPLDQQGTSTGISGGVQTSTLSGTTTQGTELIFSAACTRASDTYTPTGTLIENQSGQIGSQYQLVYAKSQYSQGYTQGFSFPDSGAMIIASFVASTQYTSTVQSIRGLARIILPEPSVLFTLPGETRLLMDLD